MTQRYREQSPITCAALFGMDFDDITIVTVAASRKAAVLTLKYGAVIGPLECRR